MGLILRFVSIRLGCLYFFQVEKETFSTLLAAAKILHFYKTNFPKTFSELKVQVMSTQLDIIQHFFVGCGRQY